MKSSATKKLVGRNEPIEPNETKQKKKYSPPRFAVLTPDQAKLWLTEKALPGEAATDQFLTAASRLGSGGVDEQRGKLRQTKKKPDTRN